ncbi:DNA replication factor C complex subunit Rfc1 [Tilletia horrida]|uniref:Replication factor C subunit 1 n=1 Tax=Tilletia horrida TaxID=155126 RepID=A0AAN6GQE3_9BASI|nr:DNA replication factor C complex subunit Rfc1 [Tilletia horrida]
MAPAASSARKSAAGSTPNSSAEKTASKSSSTPKSASAAPAQKKLDNYFSKASTSSSPSRTKTPTKPSTAKSKPAAKEVIEIEDDESDDDKPVASISRSASASKSKKRGRPQAEDDDDFEDAYNDDDDDFEMEEAKPKPSKIQKKASPAKAIKKEPAAADAPASTSKRAASTSPSKKKSTPVKAEKKEAETSKSAVKKESAAAEDEEPAEKPKPKWPFKGNPRTGPSNPGGKPIPEGKPNCLNGLTFVFTGELETIDREQATELVRRYGARVTSGPSSKTSYVVVGTEPGNSKLAMIKKHKLPTLDEDGLLNLIATRGAAPLTSEQKQKIKEEEAKVKEAAKKLDTEVAKVDPNSLWTVKYAPRSLKDIVANKGNVEKLQTWLQNWSASVRCGFKKPGKDAMGTFRAVLISGPPGIGKTTTAHLVAKLEGFDPIELNASDARSKKLVEMSLKDTLDNANLDGYLRGKPLNESQSGGIKISPKTCLIMDEVDGMSGGDRGGVGAINALIKKTKIPIICICNDRRNKKMQPFLNTCFNMTFRKPETKAILSRMMSIAFKEGIKISGEVMQQLIDAAEGDLRLVINMLSTWKLSSNSMTFDEAKAFGAANAKPGIHTPFTLYSELAGPYMFSHTSRKTLNDKSDFYFQDFSLMPLMVQENYIRQVPVLAGREPSQRLKDYETMKLITKAAMSVSDGDLIDSMIHGGDQHWSLMPHHAIASCVRPMSFTYGKMSGHFPSFPSWLGQNSKGSRLRRNVVDLQARMRLATLGGCSTKQELRQDYQPVLWQRLIKPIVDHHSDGIDEVIGMMDDYYLGIEDRDAILELGLGANDVEIVGKKIPSATKSAFTRKYNAATHPMAFVKAFDVSKAKPLKGAEVPDVEEAIEEDLSEAEVVDADEGDSDIEIDISKSKGIKKAKAKPVKGKGKGKAK